MKTCVLLAMSLFFLLIVGCTSSILDYPSQDQAWTLSNEAIVTVYNCRVLPPDNSWDTDVPPSPPYPDKTKYIAAIFNGQARNLAPRMSAGWDHGIPLQAAGARPEKPLIKLVMRDENSRVKS